MIKRPINYIYIFLSMWGIVLAVAFLYFEYYPQYQICTLLVSSNITSDQADPTHRFKQSFSLSTRGYTWSKMAKKDSIDQYEQMISLKPTSEKDAQFVWYVTIPLDCEYLVVDALLRSHDINAVDKKWKGGRLDLQFLDTNGKVRWDIGREIVKLLGNNDWKTYQKIFPVPEHTRFARLIISHSGKGGVLYGKNIKVTDVVPNPSFDIGKRMVEGIFLALLLIGLLLFMQNRQISYFVLLVMIVIGVGTTLPNYLLADTVQHTIEYTKRIYMENVNKMIVLPAPEDMQQVAMANEEKEIQKSRDQAISLIKKSGHFGLYTILGFLVFRHARQKNQRFDNMVLYGVALILFATTTEVSQFFTDTRNPHFSDLLMNFLGLATGTLISVLFCRGDNASLPTNVLS